MALTHPTIGPLLVAFIVVPLGRPSVAWFSLAALLGMVIFSQVGGWYSRYCVANAGRGGNGAPRLPRNRVTLALVFLAILVFTKTIYTASFTSYYTLPDRAVRAQHPSFAADAVRLPRGHGARRGARRPGR